MLIYLFLQSGNTPLHLAILWGYDKIAEILTTAGADVNFVNKVS